MGLINFSLSLFSWRTGTLLERRRVHNRTPVSRDDAFFHAQAGFASWWSSIGGLGNGSPQ